MRDARAVDDTQALQRCEGGIDDGGVVVSGCEREVSDGAVIQCG